jgi:hypothetical protein
LKPITGSLSVTLEPVTVALPTPASSLLGVAEGLLPALRLLAASPQPMPHAVALLGAHVLECGLKAALAKAGTAPAELRSRHLGHNLVALWQRTAASGVLLPDPAPGWLNILGRLHASPYRLRYAEGTHGLVLPAVAPLLADLEAIVGLVRTRVDLSAP